MTPDYTPEAIRNLLRVNADQLRVNEALAAALETARKELEHLVPEECWATGPLTGDPIQDLVVCPGCATINKIDTVIAKAHAQAKLSPTFAGAEAGATTAAGSPLQARPHGAAAREE